jgi:hypothetical protein
MPNWIQQIIDWANSNPGKVVGIMAGFLLFLLLILLGPMFLMFLLLLAAGFVVGKSVDDNVPVQTLLRKWMGMKPKGDEKEAAESPGQAKSQKKQPKDGASGDDG